MLIAYSHVAPLKVLMFLLVVIDKNFKFWKLLPQPTAAHITVVTTIVCGTL